MYIQIATDIAILGALYVASNRALAANIMWSLSNPMLIFYNVMNGQPEQATMFVVFSVVAMYGIYHLMCVERVTWYDADEWMLFKKRCRST